LPKQFRGKPPGGASTGILQKTGSRFILSEEAVKIMKNAEIEFEYQDITNDKN